MIPIVIVSVVLGAVVLWALYADPTPIAPVARPRRLHGPLTENDIRMHDAPLVVAGYDPRWIDHHLRQVSSFLQPGDNPPGRQSDDPPPSVLDD